MLRATVPFFIVVISITYRLGTGSIRRLAKKRRATQVRVRFLARTLSRLR